MEGDHMSGNVHEYITDFWIIFCFHLLQHRVMGDLNVFTSDSLFISMWITDLCRFIFWLEECIAIDQFVVLPESQQYTLWYWSTHNGEYTYLRTASKLVSALSTLWNKRHWTITLYIHNYSLRLVIATAKKATVKPIGCYKLHYCLTTRNTKGSYSQWTEHLTVPVTMSFIAYTVHAECTCSTYKQTRGFMRHSQNKKKFSCFQALFKDILETESTEREK